MTHRIWENSDGGCSKKKGWSMMLLPFRQRRFGTPSGTMLLCASLFERGYKDDGLDVVRKNWFVGEVDWIMGQEKVVFGVSVYWENRTGTNKPCRPYEQPARPLSQLSDYLLHIVPAPGTFVCDAVKPLLDERRTSSFTSSEEVSKGRAQALRLSFRRSHALFGAAAHTDPHLCFASRCFSVPDYFCAFRFKYAYNILSSLPHSCAEFVDA
ncbi:hypothetical protein EDD18DRAFT_1170452 [Armillaria luteobubalina]|uniref:Uncharacterized protein n=1 Tax=Armillaria luteobubalina TaxID=153913 RepID=A0AA39Q4X3_9AGAR|nr:hypothetical protein EDD18DRAFT_1170452 [Armillaria luteobubalina]